MKKLMRLEIFLLAVLLLGAGVFAVMISVEPQESTPVIAEATLPPVTQETTVPAAPDIPAPAGPGWMTFPDSRVMKARQYFVYDSDGDSFLVNTAAEGEKVYPASITKLFTAYVAMEYLKPDTQITAQSDVLEMVVWGSSVADIQEGDTLTAGRMVEAMLLPSGNDAAYLLAVAAGRKIAQDDSISARAAAEVFVKQMNTTAQELGMTGTHFVNPDGIHDENHYTTFPDLAILGKMALQNATILSNAQTAQDKVELASGEKNWENTNALISEESPYYCPYALGLKTGQTPSAGSCLLSAFQMDGKTLLIGVFGCPEADDRFEDTLQLFNNAMGI